MRHCFCLRETPELTAAIGEVRPLPTESLPCAQALGRVLGGDIRAPLSWPPFPRSTRDGFAVRTADTTTATALAPVALRCTGSSPVGGEPSGVLRPGEAWRVVTGSSLPEGADAVVMQEDAAVEGVGLGAICHIFTPVAPGEHIMVTGHDLHQGDLLARSGSPLHAHTVALLAQFLTHIPVRRRPVLGILATGDEFCHARPSVPAAQAQLLPSNAILLECLGKAHGAQVAQLGTLPDVTDTLRGRLLAALENRQNPCDVLVVFGGSSGGPRDCTARAIASLPGCRLYGRDQVVSTGRPLTLARAGHTWLWGLPGHAMGLSLAAHVFLVPMLRRMAGMAEATGNGGSRLARLAHALPAQSTATEHYPVVLTTERGRPTAWPVCGGTGKLALLRDLSGWISLRGTSDVRPSYDAAMHAVGFTQPQALANRPFHALSGGEKQRVALASRLALRPRVLLLDEPTSNVDARSAQALVTAVRDCMAQGTSVVYATHDHALLDALGGRELRLGETLVPSLA